MTRPNVKSTEEAQLRDLIKIYCVKHNIPMFPSGTNGVTIQGWSIKPDEVMGKPGDDLLTKCIIFETKPTKYGLKGAVTDLQSKEEYKAAKFLAAVYYENGKPCGSLHSWRNPKGKLGFEEVLPTQPLDKFINELYTKVYKPAINPVKMRIVNEAIKLTGQYTSKEIFSIMSGSFTSQENPGNLPYSLNGFWSLCDEINRPLDKTEILHDIVFAPDTHKERHKWGQFITEYPHSLKIAEKVVEVFDEHQDLTIYEPCIGTGAIACEVLTLLFRKYGKKKSQKIMTEQMKFADIGPRMRAYAEVVLYNHTEKLFGNGIRFTIEKNDLETDSFDLSKMIVYGNYPFNKGTDYNYLAKIFRQQIKCGLSLGIFMGDSATFDSRKVQSRKILGEDFYTWIKEEYSTNDFKDVAVKISVVSFDRSRKKVQRGTINTSFTTLKDLGVKILYVHDFAGKIRATRFTDKTPLRRSDFTPTNSMCFIQPRDLTTKDFSFRIPKEDAPVGSRECEVYKKWLVDRKAYPKKRKYNNLLIIAVKATTNNFVPMHYFDTFEGVIDDATVLQAPTNMLCIVGLILQSNYFQQTLYKHFPKFQRVQRVLRVNKLKTLPIPKETGDNKDQFNRLREIGQTLIIEGKEDEALRKEADKIIEELYKGLKLNDL